MIHEHRAHSIGREMPAGALVGAITSVKAGTVRGWVDNADPKRALALFVGRRRIATTTRWIAVDGVRSKFAFDAKGCPPDLLVRPELAIDVAILGDAPRRFASVTIATDTFLAPADLPAAAQPGVLEGCIDEAGPNLLRGWVRDASRPERQLEIFLFRGERYVGKYLATRPRPDLADSGRGHGDYGFEIPLQGSDDALVVLAGDPDFWRVPVGAHAVAGAASAGATARRLRHAGAPGSLEAFARALAVTEPFPRKAFVIDRVKRGAVPDAFSADYVALALECLRHEMVATSEAMGGGWRDRVRSWIALRLVGVRMRRLAELAAAIAEGPRLLEAAAARRKPADG